jgi:hypothetical protein
MKIGNRLNTVALVISIIVVVMWLASIRMRENLEGDSKALKYVRDAAPEKFLNPYIIYGLAKETTDDEEKLARIIPLAKANKRDALIEHLESL